jgi:hypothetical protein
MLNQKLLIKALIGAIIWYLTYLYIRRYMNPQNNNNIDKYKTDALYGALANFTATILKDQVQNLIK